jgi:hypothetical protein
LKPRALISIGAEGAAPPATITSRHVRARDPPHSRPPPVVIGSDSNAAVTKFSSGKSGNLGLQAYPDGPKIVAGDNKHSDQGKILTSKKKGVNSFCQALQQSILNSQFQVLNPK